MQEPSRFPALPAARILDRISDAVAWLDREWRYAWVNARAAELSSMTVEQMVGRTIWELFPALDGTEMERACRGAMGDGQPRRFDFFYAPTGRWFEQRVEPAEDGLLIVSTDITGRKEAEARLDSALSAMSDAVLALDRDWKLTFMNATGLQWLGRTAEQVSGVVVWDLFPGYLGTPIEEAMRAVMDRREPIQLTSRGPMSDRWFDVRIDPSPDGLVMTSRDVDDQRQAIERARASEERFRNLAESMPQIVWTAAPDGTITFINHQWGDLTGNADLEGTNDAGTVEPVVHPDDLDRAVSLWQRSLETGEVHEVQWRFRRRSDGSWRWFLTRAVPIRDVDGRIREWFGTATDIHDQKITEQMLMDSERRRSEFLAVLAHELRNPLHPMVIATKLLRDGTRSDHAVAVLDRQLLHLVRLVDDLLDVNRITRNRLELRLQAVELGAVVRSALEASAPLIDERRHRVTVELPDGPVWLRADPTRLSQVFANLLTNAAKYTDPGGRIRVRATALPAAVEVRVADDGIGIAEEQRSRLFEMFSQVDPALGRSQGGLGIGLALVRGLVEMHGGQVSAHSDGLGRGSEFVVRLPAGTPSEDGEPGELEATPLPQRKRRVLVVDDLHDAAESLASMLRGWGYQVEVAHDALGALERARASPPEVLLLDVGLPGIDGYELARRVRAEPWGARAVLVAVTGWGQEADKQRARDAGFDHHMTKPIAPRALERLLATLA